MEPNDGSAQSSSSALSGVDLMVGTSGAYSELLRAGLEAARKNIYQRAQTLGIPSSISVDWPSIKQEGGVTRIHYTRRIVSSLNDALFSPKLRDPPNEESSLFGFGFKDEFDSLSQLLVKETDLGSRPGPAAFMPTTPETVRNYYLVPLALHYLKSLSSLDMPDAIALEKLCLEFDSLLSSHEIIHVAQLLVSGIRTFDADQRLQHENVELRSLSEDETNLIWQLSDSLSTLRPYLDSKLIPPGTRFWSLPSSVLSVLHRCPEYPCSHHEDILKKVNQLVLALFLKDYEISGYGQVAFQELPLWLRSAYALVPFPLHEKHLRQRSISADEFSLLVDFARTIPSFGRVPSSSCEVALFSGLRAFGADFKESVTGSQKIDPSLM